MKAAKTAFALACCLISIIALIPKKIIDPPGFKGLQPSLEKLNTFQISQISGNGQVYADIEETKPISLADLFSSGRITAKADRQTSFEFFHRQCMFIALPETHIHFRADTNELTLLKGEIFWRNPKNVQQQHLFLHDSGNFIVLSESGHLRYNQPLLEIWNYSGEAELSLSHKSFQIASQQYLQVSGQREPKMHSLLPAPKITSPSVLSITLQNPNDAITNFLWRAVEGANRYVFRLYSSSLKENLLLNETVHGNTLNLNLLHYTSWGNLYWEVSALDERTNQEGIPSSLGYIHLAGKLFDREKQEKPPQLIISSLSVSGDMVLIRGETSPFCRVFINDSEVKVDSRGTFTFTVTYQTVGTKEIEFKAVNAAGAETVERRQVVIFAE